MTLGRVVSKPSYQEKSAIKTGVEPARGQGTTLTSPDWSPPRPIAARSSLPDWGGGGRLAWWWTISHLPGRRFPDDQNTKRTKITHNTRERCWEARCWCCGTLSHALARDGLQDTWQDRRTKRRQDKKTRQDEKRRDKTRQDKTRREKTRLDKTRKQKASQNKQTNHRRGRDARRDKTRQDKTRQDKTRQDKTGRDTIRHDKTTQN